MAHPVLGTLLLQRNAWWECRFRDFLHPRLLNQILEIYYKIGLKKPKEMMELETGYRLLGKSTIANQNCHNSRLEYIRITDNRTSMK